MDYEVNGVIFHHGIKGMKWGRRRFQNNDGSLTPAGKKRYGSDSGGIAGAIRKKQRSNAENDLTKVRSQKRQVDSELRELRGYDKNPSALGRSKISTAIRRGQIKSLEKTRDSLKKSEKENVDTLKELDDIECYQTKKRADKARQKELEKEYDNSPEGKAAAAARRKKALKIGAAVAGTALAAYGAKKFHDYIRSENGKLAQEAGYKAMKEASNWSSITGLSSLSRDYRMSGNYGKHLELEDKISNIVVDYGLKTQRDMEKLRFDKAVANVYLNKRRG